ncbi:MAG: hypothetical protein AAF485_16420, partial [Chloroflexota bacterium]
GSAAPQVLAKVTSTPHATYYLCTLNSGAQLQPLPSYHSHQDEEVANGETRSTLLPSFYPTGYG